MELEGIVEDIIYQNEVNSYTVAALETKEEEITIVGYLPFINSGDTLKLTGRFVEHKEYGPQFKVDTFEKIMPQTLSALEKYLSNGTIKGIGPVTAKKIVDMFGDDTINVFKFEPEKLANIKGISKEKAQVMAESFIENWEVWQIVGFLEKFGIGVENAKKVYKLLGANAIDEIESNPYILIDIARGVDFKKIDQMALELGITYDNDKRVESGIKYALIRTTYNGHCCTLKENLIEFVIQLLDVTTEIVEDNIINLKVKNEIIIEERNGNEWVYLYNFYKTEKGIATKIMSLVHSKNAKHIKNIEKRLYDVEGRIDMLLSNKQKEAVMAINESNVTIITGGPGTGKTTIIKSIIEIYKLQGKKVVLCAPTGRAAKRITETTGEEASTLHRLLEIGKFSEDDIYKNEQDYEGMPIDADVIVVDEVSMVDMFLMDYLLSCIYKGTKLVLVGDVDQLPSVGPGSVLKDLIASEQITTVHLDKIFRQAAKSKIIVNAHRVNNGEPFLSKQDMEDEEMNQDFFFIKKSDQESALKEIISLCNGRLKDFGDYDFFQNIQVITPTKKGMLGTKELNKALQDVLNPHIDGEPEKSNLGMTFRVGDRVMQIKNNYDINWERDIDIHEIGSGVFNGEMGTILKINTQEKIVKIKFDDEKVCWYEFSELDQIEHSYCITIHKSQGSEFDVVIMVAPQAAPMLLTRNLLYTGITRAKKLLIIVGSDKVISYMIQNVDSKKRNTGLEYKLRNLPMGT
ncbi:MAG: ATP-dependent RecD-like DNA helicase [Clostridia bacterium]|nr:ATP-dependent RecD-like DNA helicase [Clostridia bacterium]